MVRVGFLWGGSGFAVFAPLPPACCGKPLLTRARVQTVQPSPHKGLAHHSAAARRGRHDAAARRLAGFRQGAAQCVFVCVVVVRVRVHAFLLFLLLLCVLLACPLLSWSLASRTQNARPLTHGTHPHHATRAQMHKSRAWRKRRPKPRPAPRCRAPPCR
jgi:hypothetical protein